MRHEVSKKTKFLKSRRLAAFVRGSSASLGARLRRDKTTWQGATSQGVPSRRRRASDFFPRINRPRSYPFDRGRHRVFGHCASQHQDRRRAGSSYKAPIRCAIPFDIAGTRWLVCRGREIRLLFIERQELRDACSHIFERIRHCLNGPRPIFGRDLSPDGFEFTLSLPTQNRLNKRK